jgi:alkylhydroperoxidase family enzyme
MARLPPVPLDEIAPTHPDIARRTESVFRVLAHSPAGTDASLEIGRYMRVRSKLDARLRELAVIQVACLVRSRYAFYHHIDIGSRVGVTEGDIDALIAETRGETTQLPALERAVLRMSRQMTGELRVDDGTFSALEQALGREQLVDLALVVSYYNGVVRLVACFQAELEPEFEALVTRFPLPA